MIKVENFSYSFPDKDLYNKVSFTIEPGQSCAFIGSSGSGKSTFAEIIMNPDEYMFDGTLQINVNTKIGYVRQFYDYDKDDQTTVFDYIAEDFIAMQDKIAEICTEMETATELDELLEQYQETLDAFDAVDGDNYESSINKKLNLANLQRISDLEICKLSGGEFKLVQVIKQMLNSPQFIIMDEPDSFLDFENINSLKNLINSHSGTILTITHSRYLLNHCFNKILHLENKDIQEFDGNYIDYNFELLASKVEAQEMFFADCDEIKRNEALIDKLRFIATNYDSSAFGRALKARMKIKERLEKRRIHNPFIDINQPKISLSTEDVVEDEFIVSVKDFELSFKEKLLENVSFDIAPTDKVAIIGANGTGKTSLIREIFKNNSPAITISDDATVSYLSQKQDEMLKEENSIYDEFFDAGFESYDEISQYLDGFLFPEDRMNQKISALSGGEKNILQLAKLSHEKRNLLILDEPISHLDTYSQIALEKAISDYNGAILMVSHDFYSIANCMDYVLIIENKTIRKMRMRTFRKMIYADHFNKDYLQIEQDKKAMETRIEAALYNDDFENAKLLLTELENIIKSM